MSKKLERSCLHSWKKCYAIAAEQFDHQERITCTACGRQVKPFKSTAGQIYLPLHFADLSQAHRKHQLRQIRVRTNENDSHGLDLNVHSNTARLFQFGTDEGSR